MLGAFYLAFSTPLALAIAPPVSKTDFPNYLKRVSPVQPISDVVPPEQSYVPLPAPPPPTDAYNGTGDYYLDWIVAHESGGNPYAMNSIGACGLFQALPCSKMGCALSNVACQIAWGRSYVIDAYGSSYAAYIHWLNYRWY